jgi:hypothetical protein
VWVSDLANLETRLRTEVEGRTLEAHELKEDEALGSAISMRCYPRKTSIEP